MSSYSRSVQIVFFYGFIYVIYLLNMWVLREAANDQQLTATVSCWMCFKAFFAKLLYTHEELFSGHKSF